MKPQSSAVPLVSVVMIFLNEERFLEEAVQSVRDQKLSDWELILVDDGSTDRSRSIAKDLAARDPKIRYVEHPDHENRGMSASRNLGVAHATAPYIAFLDADDIWLPDKLAEQVEVLETMPDVAMVAGAKQYWYSWDPGSTKTDRIVLTGEIADRRLDPPEAALTLYPLGTATGAGTDFLVRRSVFESVGGFEEHFRGRFEDQAFVVKIFLNHPVYFSSRIWLRYRQHDASCSVQTNLTNTVRQRGEFLGWLLQSDDVRRLDDQRISAAIQRRRRELSYLALVARLVDRLPPRLLRNLRELVWRIRFSSTAHPAGQ